MECATRFQWLRPVGGELKAVEQGLYLVKSTVPRDMYRPRMLYYFEPKLYSGHDA